MMKFLSRLGDSNEKEIRRLEPTVARINELEPEFTVLSDDALRAKTEEFRARLREQLGDLLLPFEQRPVADDEEDDSALTGADPARLSEEAKARR
jgi:hypothetical protein